MSEPVRTFIAVELPEPVKEALGRIIADLQREARAPIRWVWPQGIHLTLRFLGPVDASDIPRLIEAVRGAIAGHPCHHLSLSRLGAFPSASRARVVWVGLQGDVESLQRLQASVEQAVRRLGFPPEERPFTPHLTLGRLSRASPPEFRRLAEALQRVPVPPGTGFRVTAVAVMRSDLRPTGAVYTPLAQLPLEPPGA